MSRTQKTKPKRLQLQRVEAPAWRRPGCVKILARYLYRAAVFSLPERKIHTTKLLPFKQERL